MVTCRACKPKLQVRFLVLHPIIVLFLIVGVFAVDVSDVDDSQYYESSVVSPFFSFIQPLADNVNDRTFFGISFKYRYSDMISMGGKTLTDITFTDFGPMFQKALSNIDASIEAITTSDSLLQSRLTTLENEAVRQSDLTPIQSLLTTYLPRIDANTSGLHGDLLNIQSALGWTSGDDTILSILSDVRDSIGLSATSSSGTVLAYLRSISSGISTTIYAIDNLSNAVQTGFSNVTARQDAAQEWSKALWGSGPFSYSRVRYGQLTTETGDFTDFLSTFSTGFYRSNALFAGAGALLAESGRVDSQINDVYFVPEILRRGFLGLSANIAGSDKTASMTVWQGPDNTQTLSATNLLDMLGLLGTQLQSPLAKLAYVWADDDDIRIADKNQPVKDQIEEDFVGSGQGAVSASQIGGLADASSDFTSTFSGGGSITDVFNVINDSGSYGFFSQEVADEIEPPLPSMQSDEDIQEQVEAWEELSEDDEFLSRFKVSDSGYLIPDLGIFDVSGYLEAMK